MRWNCCSILSGVDGERVPRRYKRTRDCEVVIFLTGRCSSVHVDDSEEVEGAWLELGLEDVDVGEVDGDM